MKTKNKQLQRLVEKHQQLDDQVDEISSQRHLFPSEQLHLKDLKIKRLYARREIEKYKKKLDSY